MDVTNKVNKHIAAYDDWRGELLNDLRKLINATAPELIEEFKWGVPVWTHHGLVCAISGFKDHVKMNFFKGAYLSDPKGLFNSGLDSKEHRSINFTKDSAVDTDAIKKFLVETIAYNER